MRRLASALAFALLLLHAVHAQPRQDIRPRRGIQPVDLRTEAAVYPLAIETDTPELAWKLTAPPGSRNKMQSAYEVFVAADASALRLHQHGLWSSARVASSSVSTRYNGPALHDLQAYFWSVRVWDEAGTVSAWSAPATFTVGPRQSRDWDNAQWIAGRSWALTPGTPPPPAPELRRAFTVHKPIVSARLDVSGLGYYVLRLDGKPLDDRVLAPGWTSYNKRVLYDSYDVTSRLSAGDHALGVVLGRGFYANAGLVLGFLDPGDYSARDPKLLLRLRLTYADGSTESIVTDNKWRAHDGPTLANYAYQGETYDARLETPGWAAPGFNAASWSPARVVAAPEGHLAAEIFEPIRIVDTIAPDRLTQLKPGTWRFDFPHVMAGWAQLHVRGPAGTRVVLRYAEQLKADGSADNRGDPGITPGDIQTDTFILRGDPAGETWHPQFSFKSFAFVQVDGFPGTPTLASLNMQVVHTDLASAGTFTCSSPLLNQIQAMLLRSTLSNFQSIPSDTPMYEKRGWLGDAQVMAATALDNFALDRFYLSRVQGIADDQRANGSLPVLSPEMNNPNGTYQDNAWSSAFLVIPWQVYRDDNDTEILRVHYAGMARYVDYINGLTVDGILDGLYGDWLPPTGPMGGDIKLVETAYLYQDEKRLAQIAPIAGHPEDAAHWNELATHTYASFNRAFLKRDRAMYFNAGETKYHQTANALPLAFDLVPEELRQQVADHLAADVVAKGNHLDTGIIGTEVLLPVLSSTGHADLALAVAEQTTQPSWGYMLEKTQGRTGLWEAWGFDKVRSLNHMMFGTIGDWFYTHLAGIQTIQPGFRSFKIAPDFTNLDSVAATRITPYGKLSVSWARAEGVLEINVTVPVDTTAEISIPAHQQNQVREGTHPFSTSRGVTFLREQNGRLIFLAGSGTYTITTQPL